MERANARRLSREFKLSALARMAAGENVSALGRELGVRRKLLYQWRDTVRRGGAEALRGVGRPPAAERLVRGPARPRGGYGVRGYGVTEDMGSHRGYGVRTNLRLPDERI
jgi:hypothetical protein